MDQKISFRIPEAIEATGLGRTTIYRRIQAGDIRVIKVGATTIIPRDSLVGFLARLDAEQNPGSAEAWDTYADDGNEGSDEETPR